MADFLIGLTCVSFLILIVLKIIELTGSMIKAFWYGILDIMDSNIEEKSQEAKEYERNQRDKDKYTCKFNDRTLYLMESEGCYEWFDGTKWYDGPKIDSKWKYVYKGDKIPGAYEDIKNNFKKLKIINE